MNIRSTYIFVLLLMTFLKNLYPLKGQDKKEILLYNRVEKQISEEQTQDSIFGLLVSRVTNPSIAVFTPKNQKSKSAVIICPGGGYHTLLMEREGYKVAEAFNRCGITAFVLKYRLPDSRIVKDKMITPLKDAQRAIQLIRENAEKWNIDPDKTGIMGFSAGGHLAASLGVHYDSVLVQNKQNTSLRPSFMILINPVISFNDSTTHEGSRNQLLGVNPEKEMIHFFSNELHVNKQTPETILIHTNDDKVVSVKNSIFFYKKLYENEIPVEIHIYSRGDHGFLQIPEFEEWFDRCIHWMNIEKIM
ncbi:MAG: alpha/beta hydrolase [Proteiniphilum sp.]|nr:alpha/beta hydrolase [Proteiniphilum sp.]MDD3908657.1 alpha/beta hydrolase [Proteiniphilum sp.]MDD4416523.1 alpha/beta hydrolase [Proteiniphilum sp.]